PLSKAHEPPDASPVRPQRPGLSSFDQQPSAPSAHPEIRQSPPPAEPPGSQARHPALPGSWPPYPSPPPPGRLPGKNHRWIPALRPTVLVLVLKPPAMSPPLYEPKKAHRRKLSCHRHQPVAAAFPYPESPHGPRDFPLQALTQMSVMSVIEDHPPSPA